MNIISKCNDYLDGKITSNDLIRSLSGAFDPNHAVTLLALINGVTRVEDGDMDKDMFRSIYLGNED
jgi:Ca2+-binding EF-hand superfamily protein